MSLEYRKEIDGLRAFAVLSVILYHAGFKLFRGGFIGVDVFFVISGFLITALLVGDLKTGSFSLLGFYDRRMRRILPALYLVLIICLPAAWLLLYPRAMGEFSRSLAAVVTFCSNVYFLKRHSGYFGINSELEPVLHTWSLAVEEQYYLLFPIFLWALYRWARGKILLVFSFLFIMSLIFAQWACVHHPIAAFYLLPTRGWEFLMGGIPVLLLSQKEISLPFVGNYHLREGLAFSGLLLLVYSILMFDKDTLFPGLHAVVPTLGAILVIQFADSGSIPGRLLGTPIMVGVGLISYSAYLWHYPLFVFTRILVGQNLSSWTYLGLVFLTLLLAYISWKYVERPFRNRQFLNRYKIAILALIGCSVFVLFGVGGKITNGYGSWRLNAHQKKLLITSELNPLRDKFLFEAPNYIPPMKAIEYFGKDIQWAVLGNSHGDEIAYELALRLKPSGVGIKEMTFNGAPPAFHRLDMDNPYTRWTLEAMTYLMSHPEIKNVVVSYSICPYLFGPAGRYASSSINNISENEKNLIWGSYRDTVNTLIASGKKVFLILQAPEIRKNAQDLIFSEGETKNNIIGVSLDRWNRRRAFVMDHLGEFSPRTKIIDPTLLFSDDQNCYAVRNGVSYYYDDNHMSLAGASLVVDEIFKNK